MTEREAIKQLSAYFHRNGYVRRFDPARRESEGRDYHRGSEIRLVADSAAELATIQRMLKRVGFKPGQPFERGRQWRQPVYGVAQVERFLALVGEPDRR